MRTYNKLGNFQMESSVMRISDPMYNKDVWCAATLDNCATGTWSVQVGIQDEGIYGNRVAILYARHANGPSFSAAEKIYSKDEDEGSFIYYPRAWKIIEQIGVDSATCGMFDDSVYQGGSIEAEVAETVMEEWIDTCWNLTRGSNQAGILPGGCVCTSGYGDGVYPAFYHTNTKGQVDAVAVVFL